MNASCDAGYQSACDSLSREDQAKRAWLAKLDVPTWSAAAAAVSAVASEVTQAQPEDEAQKAWLARLNTTSSAIHDSAARPMMSEEAAKRAWLASLDAPTWGAAAATLAS